MEPKHIRDAYPKFKVMHPVTFRAKLREIGVAYEGWYRVFFYIFTNQNQPNNESRRKLVSTPRSLRL